MTTRYLLSCKCGKKLPVAVHEAGLNVPCSCGAQVEVPPRRDLTRLERVAEAPAKTAAPWGPRQGALFLGSALCVVALVALGLLRLFPPFDRIARQIDQADSQELVLYESALRTGIMVDPKDPLNLELKADTLERKLWTKLAWSVLAAGLVTAAAAALMPQPKKSPRR